VCPALAAGDAGDERYFSVKTTRHGRPLSWWKLRAGLREHT
jgi:hypothetical protein